jgi:choline monooxygenase
MVVSRSTHTPDWAEQLKAGWTLPAHWYTDRAILEQEQAAIFDRTWQYAGYMERVAQPGDYFTCRCGNVPIVVLRDADHQLRAFVNVCRHRASEIVCGAGKALTLQCPYHAWTYGLDGSLQGVPRRDRELNFDQSELGLIPVKVDHWGALIFVNLDLGAEPLSQYLGAFPEVMLSSGINFETLKYRGRTEFELAANWKVVAENYLECYHCLPNHPKFSHLINVDPDAYRLRAIDNTLVAQAPLRHAPNSDSFTPYQTAGEVKESLFTLLFPNSAFDIMPGCGNLTVYWFIPIAPDRTYGVFEYFLSEEADSEFERQFTAFQDEVGEEDVALIESVQRGLQSGKVPHGRLMLDSERLIQHFQNLVWRSLT